MIRSQAVLVGGTILTIVLVAIVLPVILNMISTGTMISESVKQVAQVRLEAYREKVQVIAILSNESVIGGGQAPAAILINNTGTTRVIIERVILINASSGRPIDSTSVCGDAGICGIINIPYAARNPLVKNAVTPFFDNCYVGIIRSGNGNIDCLDPGGRVAVLNPGDALYITIDPNIVPKLGNVVVYAESAYGVIHPVVSLPLNATGLGGGPPIPKEAIPTGLYTPISGYIRKGYSELINYTYVQLVHPPYRVSTVGPHPKISVYLAVSEKYAGSEPPESKDQRLYCGGVPFQTAGFNINSVVYLGTYNLTFSVQRTSYLYVYGDGPRGRGWYAIELDPEDEYTIVGYIGAIGLMTPQQSGRIFSLIGGCPYSQYDQLLVVDGWAWDILVNGRSIKDIYGIEPVSWTYPASQSQLIAEGVISRSDYDDNGMTELHVSSFKSDGYWDGLDIDGSRTIYTRYAEESYVNSDDVAMINITVLRDITGVDAVQVAVKVGFSYSFLLTGMPDDTPSPLAYLVKPVVAVGLLRLDPDTYRWRLVNIETKEFTLGMPKTFWINVVFPVNKTDVYRIVIYLYDPYGLINIGANALHGWCADYTTLFDVTLCNAYATILSTIETRFYLEHIIVQYYVHNPLLKRIPVVYLVNITGVPYWPDGFNSNYGRFGYISETELSVYWDRLLSSLQSMGIYPVVVNNWEAFTKLLGGRDAPRDAIVVFLHGPIVPWQRNLKLYDPVSDSYMTTYAATDMARWLAYMIRGRGWVVVFPYGPPMAFAFDTSNAELEDYTGGDLLVTLLKNLRPELGDQISAKYIFVATGGFTYPGGSLDNYTVTISDIGINAARMLKIWLIPRSFVGNYTVVSSTSVFYESVTPLWWNTTPPPGRTWNNLGVPSDGYALGAGYISDAEGKGALVMVAAPRPGVINPDRLAGLDILASLYAWKMTRKS